jgi:asparagine synthase (glutamine-hydrolysing)
MCGICGVLDLKGGGRVVKTEITAMAETLKHRGPDSMDTYIQENLALGFTRLSIIDLEGGMQPMFNEDKSLVLVCNGEIFNYIELRQDLEAKGHRFKSKSDVEVILHLFEEHGADFINRLNGQFAFVLYDFKKKQLLAARDHFGVIPFHYTIKDNLFIFASEVKAILEHSKVQAEPDLVALDQVFSFPGLISPRTAFKHIRSLENGHYLLIHQDGKVEDVQYWDMIYPREADVTYDLSEKDYVDGLMERLERSIRLRLRADVDVGFYLSGGLDSSLITAMASRMTPGVPRHSFSIDFVEREISESLYQRMMVRHFRLKHHEKLFRFTDISERLPKVIYHCECPIKESYNTASMALSEAVRDMGMKVVLSGEGSDEFFAGYVGYRFDKMRRMKKKEMTPDGRFEDQIRRQLWGDENLFYEKNQFAFKRSKRQIFSKRVNAAYNEIDCLNHFVVNKDRLADRHLVHQRSYLDYKLRLADHLISDHGDRMAMANSVEARYPFLDKDLLEFAATIPPDLKLNEFEEKYIIKQIADRLVPKEIIKREKFGFNAPGSPYLLKRNIEYIDDILSYERIKKQGVFNPDTVENLKKQYLSDGFKLNMPYDSDLLIIVLTYGIFVEQFKMPDLA